MANEAGQRIRDLRLRAGLTQRELAARAGMAQPNIAAYESGRRIPSEETLNRIRHVLGPRPSELLSAHSKRVTEIVQSNRGRQLWIFGSTATGRDQPGSDLDILVEFEPGATLLDEAALSLELEDLLGIHVDVVSLGGLRGSIGAEIRASARPWAA